MSAALGLSAQSVLAGDQHCAIYALAVLDWDPPIYL